MKLRACLAWLFAVLAVAGISFTATDASAESRLDKVKREKKLTIGATESAPPYGFVDAKGNWVGWSMDLSKALHDIIEKKLGIELGLEFKPITPQTRIPLIVNGSLDWVLGSTGKTVAREQVVDFSLTNNAVCVKKLVPSSSSIQQTKDLAGKRVGVTKGSVEERLLTSMNQKGEFNPPVEVVPFDKHSTGFIALQQGKTDAHVTLDDTLISMMMKSKDPSQWAVRGPDLFCIINGIILQENDSDWTDMVNHSLCYFIKTGGYDKLYSEWFLGSNPKAGYKRELSPEISALIHNQCPDGSEHFLDQKT